MTDNIISQTIDQVRNDIVSEEEKFLRQFIDANQLTLGEFLDLYELQTTHVYPEVVYTKSTIDFTIHTTMRIVRKDQNVTGTDEGLSDQT